MSAVSAKDVAGLRKTTGAGIMDCKEALKESGGDLEGALDFLRKKGQKVAAKRADRDANEGIVITRVNDAGTKGIIIGISCETDFVAKNELFIEFAGKVAALAFEDMPASKDELTALPFDGSTLAEKLVDQTGKTGEKIEVSSYYKVEGDHLANYIHAGSKIGVLLSYADGGKPDADQFFRSVAMHVAAMNPSIMTPDEFDADLVAKETEAIQAQIKAENELNESENLGKAIKKVPQYVSKLQLTPEVLAAAEEQIKADLKAEGKPEKIWDKIVPGKMDRFIADNTLLDQERCLLSQFFALDDTKTVASAVKDFSETAAVVEYKRVAVG